MEFHSWFVDKKVMGINVSLDMTISEYEQLCSGIISNNPLQRKRVGAKGKVYELLRKDLLDGCVMPPIVLAVTEEYGETVLQQVRQCIESGDVTNDHRTYLSNFVEQATQNQQMLILDGLQRTNTIHQSIQDAREAGRDAEFLSMKIRAEVYLGLNKMGILYRMLTLNTGQTPMSFRHQIEILYHDFIDRDNLPDGIRVTREVDDSRARGVGNYKYQDVVDMLYAFTTGTPMSLNKQALVTELKEIGFLQGYRPGQEDLTSLLTMYNRLMQRIEELSDGWRLQQNSEEEVSLAVERPFGTTVASIFGKVQPMTGFGSEIKRLIDTGKITDISGLVHYPY